MNVLSLVTFLLRRTLPLLLSATGVGGITSSSSSSDSRALARKMGSGDASRDE